MTTAKSQAKKVIWKVGCCVRETPDITDEPHPTTNNILRSTQNYYEPHSDDRTNYGKYLPSPNHKNQKVFFFFLVQSRRPS